MTQRLAWGLGLVSQTLSGDPLDTWFPKLGLGPAPADAASGEVADELAELAGTDPERRVTSHVEVLEIDLDAAATSAPDCYLRLHLFSHRLVAPHELNTDGFFALLPNLVWTSAGPCSPTDFEATRLRLMRKYGHVTVFSIDKFPRMVDFVVPSGVRIGDADRIRLGAHVGEGTTVMHEGFINSNAGTLGVSMVEGRVSMGVVVEDGADIGGGASIMGTLSGGGKERIRVGERSLIGANAGLGIPIGSDCVIESGLYLTAGSKVTMTGWGDERDGTVVSARELKGCSGVLFRRNSMTGAIEALPRQGVGVELNPILHAHN